VPPAKFVEEDFGSLIITCDIETAEIHVDGKFIGSAPASLRLPVGPHTVVVKFSGFPDFVRLIDISKSGNQTLKATFQSPAMPLSFLLLPGTVHCASIRPLRRADQGFIDCPSPRFAGPRVGPRSPSKITATSPGAGPRLILLGGPSPGDLDSHPRGGL
jgi:hypothetical protein